jgi:hypothetical protein
MNLEKNKLILILTRECQKNCPHCAVEKTAGKMTEETAKKAVSLFVKGQSGYFLTRLLGGEPLLNLPAAKNLINFGLKNFPLLNFDLTTNGLLLDEEILDFFRKQERAELILSSYQMNKKMIEVLFLKQNAPHSISVNFNLLPQNLEKSLYLFKNLVASGIRSFNFLPAFYFPWNDMEINELEKSFKKIADFIKSLLFPIKIKNLEYSSPVWLYNLAPTVDWQGDIYAGDFFLDSRFLKLKSALKLGNIHKLKKADEIFNFPLSIDVKTLLESVFSAKILEINKRVNAKLADFLSLLNKKQ